MGVNAADSVNGSVTKTAAAEPVKAADLTAEKRGEIAVKKATCPFVGTKVNQGALAVYFAPEDKDKKHPLAKISDVVAMGNSGGGTLGYALGFFAKANQSVIPGVGQCPPGYFSLEFGGSKGAHFGDSGFLRNGPTGDGAFGTTKWNQFVNSKYVTQGKTSMVQLAKFIESNVAADPQADKGFKNVIGAAKRSIQDLRALAKSAEKMDGMTEAAKQKLVEDFGRVLGSNNLIGSAGEFALQTTLLRNSAGTNDAKSLNSKFDVAEMGNMFQMKGFPEGEQKAKSVLQWMHDSIELSTIALGEYAVRHGEAAVSGELKKLSGALGEAAGWSKS